MIQQYAGCCGRRICAGDGGITMQTFVDILSSMLPILSAIGIGVLCRKKQVLSQRTVDDLRGLISTCLLPVVIVKSFYMMQFDRATVTIVATMLLVAAAAMLLGLPLRRFFGNCGDIVPFLTTTYEGGMLGYAMFAIVMGQDNISYFARADLGGTLFVFSIFIMLILAHNTGSVSLRDSWRITCRTPTFWALLLALPLGISGVGRMIDATPAGPLVADLLNFVTAPVGLLVLIVIGYNFRVDGRVTGRVVKMLACRYAVQGLLALLVFPALHLLGALDPYTVVALALMFLLPPSFISAVYLDMEEEESAFVSFFLSVATVAGILIFLLVKALVLA